MAYLVQFPPFFGLFGSISSIFGALFGSISPIFGLFSSISPIFWLISVYFPPLVATHRAEIRRPPSLRGGPKIRHQFAIRIPQVVVGGAVVIPAEAAQLPAQLLAHRHLQLPIGAQGHLQVGALGDRNEVLGLEDGEVVGDLSWDGGRDPIHLDGGRKRGG